MSTCDVALQAKLPALKQNAQAGHCPVKYADVDADVAGFG